MPEEHIRQARPGDPGDEKGKTGPVGPVTAGGKQDHAKGPGPGAQSHPERPPRERVTGRPPGYSGDDPGPAHGPAEPAALRPRGKGNSWAAEIHLPADVEGLPEEAAYIKEQLASLGLKGGKVERDEPHPDGGRRVIVEG